MKAFFKKYAGKIFSVLILTGLALLGLTYYREIWAILTQRTARDLFIDNVRDAGIAGLGAFFALQVLQVVVAFLPGEAVELIAGLLYGTWGGLAICLAGILFGAVCVYYCVRLAGARTMDEAVLRKYHFLRDEAHVKFCLFLVFFIPGTPKDMLTYIGPFLPIKAHAFFLISTLARIPSVLSSTFAASTFAVGNWKISVTVYVLTGLIAVLCIWKQELILKIIATWKSRLGLEKKGKS